MAHPDTLTTLFGHHRWANLRLLACCAPLSDAQLDATLLGGYGSIRETLQHIVSAEQSYFARISTGQPRRPAADEAPLSLAAMAASLRITGAGLRESHVHDVAVTREAPNYRAEG